MLYGEGWREEGNMLIGIVTYDTVENRRSDMTFATLRTLEELGLYKKIMPAHRVVVVDNGSTDPQTLKFLDNWEGGPKRVIRNEKNVGTAVAMNQVIALRQPWDIVCKMDNDVVVHDLEWMSEAAEVFAKAPHYGILGLKRKDLEQRPDHPNSFFRTTLRFLQRQKGDKWIVTEDSLDVMGTCQMFNPLLLDKIGFLYQMGGLYGFEDVLACVRSRKAGFVNAFLPAHEIDHIDPGGTAYTQWKHDYSGVRMEAFNKIREQFQNGKRSVYITQEEALWEITESTRP